MRNHDHEESSNSIHGSNETTLNKQLRRIYLDQQRRRRVHEKKRRRLEKYGGCCILM